MCQQYVKWKWNCITVEPRRIEGNNISAVLIWKMDFGIALPPQLWPFAR